MQHFLIELARIGIGLTFVILAVLDIKSRDILFRLMRDKKVPQPWIMYIGAICIKLCAGTALILNYHTIWFSVLLIIYILIACVIFCNFWAVPKEQRDFHITLFATHLAICFGLLALIAGN